jgi:hypothetical protein
MKRYEIFILVGLAASAAILSGEVTSLEYGATYDCTPEDYRLKVFGCAGPADGDQCDVQAFNRAKPGPRGQSTRKEVLGVLRFCRLQNAAMARADADGSANTLPRSALRPPAQAPSNPTVNNQKTATVPAAAAPRPFTCPSGQSGLYEVSSGVYRDTNGDVFDSNRNIYTLANGETDQLISPELATQAKAAGLTMAQVGGQIACTAQALSGKEAADKRAAAQSKSGPAKAAAVPSGTALLPYACTSGQTGIYILSAGVYRTSGGDVFDANRNIYTLANGQTGVLIDADLAAKAKAAGLTQSEVAGQVACATQGIADQRTGPAK